ncbi:hypothetical protein [Vibrio mediterranei]|uniref:hypothetical protein n=1 Tax=Vibrio mediterranei TaxID=689 RepID=UPI0040683F6F
MLNKIMSWLKSLFSQDSASKRDEIIKPGQRDEIAIETSKPVEPIKPIKPQRLSKEINDEKTKVRHRLDRWVSHQTQINSRILNAYLKLERDGYTPITISMMQNQLLDVPSFMSNFNQMKTIAPHNHAKVFEVSGDIVTIWKVVEVHVRDYERKVFF